MPNLSVTHALAERHEAPWLHLAALHKDTLALGAKKPAALVSEPLRIIAEGLLCDCAPFIRQKGNKLPVAALDLAGLAVQLGQALAAMEAWQSERTEMDAPFNCLMWRIGDVKLPVLRLKPPAAASVLPDDEMSGIRERLARRINQRNTGIYQDGFAAGLAARRGPPEPEQQTYPRIKALG